MTSVSSNGFPVGSRVLLVDLTKAPQYNGKAGVIQTPLQNGRQQVLVSELSKKLAIKTTNLAYEPRPIDSLSVKELKTILKVEKLEENTAGMDIQDLRNVVSSRITDSSPEKIAEILAKVSAPTAPNTSTSATTMDSESLKNQVDAVSNLSSDQLLQQARAMRAMDPATIRRMNPQLANMTDAQVRMAIDQMESMASNPTMFQMAKEQMKNLTPEQLAQQQAALSGGGSSATTASAATSAATNATRNGNPFGDQVNNLTPDQIKQQAQAMRSMDPDTIRRMNPQLAGMSDEQIKAAAVQMETMASNPAMFDMMKKQVQNMSPEEVSAMQQGASAATTSNPSMPMDPSKLMESMDPKQLKGMVEMVKNNPELMKQAMASNPAMANMSEEELTKGLDMFSQMDDATLERTMNVVNRISKVTQPLSSSYKRANKRVGGHLLKILILLLLAAFGSVIWYVRSGGGDAASGGIEDTIKSATLASQTVDGLEQDEFETEF